MSVREDLEKLPERRWQNEYVKIQPHLPECVVYFKVSVAVLVTKRGERKIIFLSAVFFYTQNRRCAFAVAVDLKTYLTPLLYRPERLFEKFVSAVKIIHITLFCLCAKYFVRNRQ